MAETTEDRRLTIGERMQGGTALVRVSRETWELIEQLKRKERADRSSRGRRTRDVTAEEVLYPIVADAVFGKSRTSPIY